MRKHGTEVVHTVTVLLRIPVWSAEGREGVEVQTREHQFKDRKIVGENGAALVSTKLGCVVFSPGARPDNFKNHPLVSHFLSSLQDRLKEPGDSVSLVDQQNYRPVRYELYRGGCIAGGRDE